MRTLEQVWVYVDAVAPATELVSAGVEASRRSGATLTLVGAIGRAEDRMFQTSFGREILRIVRADREARLEELLGFARSSLPAERVRSTLLEGEVPWHSVVAHAVAHRPDLVMLSAAARGGGFDATAQHFFRKCPAPVWAMLPGGRHAPRRVLAAVEAGPAGSDERLLAREILDVVRMVAAGTEVELHVAQAWRLTGESVIRKRLGSSAVDEYLSRQLELAKGELRELVAASEVRSLLAATHLPQGDPVDVIPLLAERVDADVVVLGTAGRAGLPGFLIGSTAEGIIGRLARSVLVVKRPGFVSPVRP